MRRIERGEGSPIGRRRRRHLWRLRRRRRWLRCLELGRFGGAFGREEMLGIRVIGIGMLFECVNVGNGSSGRFKRGRMV